MSVTSNPKWSGEAIRILDAEQARSSDTNMYRFPLPLEWGIDLYFKDESLHPTGSLKHRLARSLIEYGVINGQIYPGATLVEASSGSTAISLAYFASLLNLKFVAFLPENTSKTKVRLIEQYGGQCSFVESASDMTPAAVAFTKKHNAVYLDQFMYAERATEWRGKNSIAESVFRQLNKERHPIPEWIVVGAGTGGTSTTFGRYVRYWGHKTKIAVADPEGSAYFPAWESGDYTYTSTSSLRIEGIGRPRVEASFLPSLIDKVCPVSDAFSIAAARLVSEVFGKSVGGSTGTNAALSFQIVAQMLDESSRGSIVTLICDSGDRYQDTYYDDDWIKSQGLNLIPATESLDEFMKTGVLQIN